MILYVVQNGDSLYTIASKYNVSTNDLITTNGLINNNLVVGQCLIIKKKDSIYYVKSGDSLFSIAKKNNLSYSDLLANNPLAASKSYLDINEPIVIGNNLSKKKIKVNGYVYPQTPLNIIQDSLPYLTYLSIFSYSINDNGSLIAINDQEIINTAKNAKVAPMMVVNNIDKDGEFNSKLASDILNDASKQDTLLNDIISILEKKGYYGINIDFEYIFPQDKEKYKEFLDKLKTRLNNNYELSVAVAPKTSKEQTGTLYEAHDYNAIGSIANQVILMTYEWGYTYSPAMPVAPIDKVSNVIDYALTEIPNNKIFMGIPNYGYDFTLPFTEGVAAKSIANSRAIEYAKSKNAAISYDDIAQTPFFSYYENNKKHMVYFEDPRSIKAKCLLALNKKLGGLSIWTISTFWKQLYEVIINYFEIEKVI